MLIGWGVSGRLDPQKCHFLYLLERPLQQSCTTVQTVITGYGLMKTTENDTLVWGCCVELLVLSSASLCDRKQFYSLSSSLVRFSSEMFSRSLPRSTRPSSIGWLVRIPYEGIIIIIVVNYENCCRWYQGKRSKGRVWRRRWRKGGQREGRRGRRGT